MLLDHALRLQRAAQIPPEAPLRRGHIGLCAACRTAATTHFDNHGRWLGCPEATTETVFVLVPVDLTAQATSATPPTPVRIAPTRSRRVRQFGVARYTATVTAGEAANVGNSAQRRRVLNVLLDAETGTGLLAREIGTRAQLSHGHVQQALNWLRRRGFVRAARA